MTDKKKGGIETRFGARHKLAQANRKAIRIEVSHWPDDEGNPLVLFAYPLTVNEIIELESRDAGSQAERNVHQIIKQCRDEQGEPYFTIADKTALLNTPADVIGAIMLALNAEVSAFDEELKKNKG